MCSGIHGPWRGADSSNRKDEELKDPLYLWVGGVSVLRRGRGCLAGEVVEEGLKDERGGDLVDDGPMVLARAAGGVENFVGFAGGETFIPEVNREAGECPEVGREDLRLDGAGTLLAGEVEGLADHDAGDSKTAGQPGDGTKIFAGVAVPVEGKDGLSGEAEFVRDGDADAFGAEVKGEIPGRRHGGHGSLYSRVSGRDGYNLGRTLRVTNPAGTLVRRGHRGEVRTETGTPR